MINSGKVKLKIIALDSKKLNRLRRGWKEKCIALTESLIEFYVNEDDVQNPFEEPELSIPFEKSKIECIEQYKNKVFEIRRYYKICAVYLYADRVYENVFQEHAVIQINTDDVQIMIEASNETEIEEWYRQGIPEMHEPLNFYQLEISYG